MISAFICPETLAKALDYLSSGEYTPIAGGTDLIPQIRQGKILKLLDISKLGLNFIKHDNDTIEIGSTVTHTMLCENNIIRRHLPLLSETCSQVGSAQIRNRGTIGGNIINASPCADSVPTLIAYEAELRLLSKKGDRNVKLSDFTRGPYQADIKPEELLYSIECKVPGEITGYSYIKLGRRQAVNISRMTLAALMVKNGELIKSIRLAGGSVFPVPARFSQVEESLVGQIASRKLFEEAGKLAADCMIKESGIRWSTPYKKPVLSGLTERALLKAAGLND
jgi:CO/xanthine dehydrogenase FAD-binding subunit